MKKNKQKNSVSDSTETLFFCLFALFPFFQRCGLSGWFFKKASSFSLSMPYKSTGLSDSSFSPDSQAGVTCPGFARGQSRMPAIGGMPLSTFAGKAAKKSESFAAGFF